MIQPFKPTHIKRYLLLYFAITLVVILFFVINHFYNPITQHQAKVFEKEEVIKQSSTFDKNQEEHEKKREFKLLNKAY